MSICYLISHSKFSPINLVNTGLEHGSAVEYQPSLHKVLGSIPSTMNAVKAIRSCSEQIEASDRMVIYADQCGPQLKFTVCSQHEAVPTEPLDALYEALAEVLMAEESTQCHRSYLLV